MYMTQMSAMVSGAVVLALGALPAVHATPPAPEELAFRGHTEISDGALGEMRGRFISADQILYFGVEMYTEWGNGTSGPVVAAALNIGIDRSNSNARPTLHVSSNVQTPNAGGSSNSSPGQISSGGLNQIQGISQVVQVTGNRNGVTNAIGVDVVTQRPAMAGPAGSLLADGNKMLIDEQTGALAQTFVNHRGAGVIVSVPTQGTASQSVTSALGMQQRAQVSGDGYTIHNQLNMVVQVQANSAVASAHMSNLSQTLRGLGQAGIN